MSILPGDGWEGIHQALSNWHVPHTCVFDLCLGFLWRLSDKWRSQADRIHLSDRWCHCCRLQGLRAWCIHFCMCVCVFKDLYLFIRKLLTRLVFVYVCARKQIYMFMYVLGFYTLKVNVCVCVCERECMWVFVCGYLLSRKPTGAKQGRMTLMRCVGMCPRVVLVWLSFCCFRTPPPLSYPALFK